MAEYAIWLSIHGLDPNICAGVFGCSVIGSDDGGCRHRLSRRPGWWIDNLLRGCFRGGQSSNVEGMQVSEWMINEIPLLMIGRHQSANAGFETINEKFQ
jgi:hypothetical protein